MNKQVLAQFRNPGSSYRGAPFWAWNGKLEPDELRRQIRVMRRMGLGGFFMHSRVGLATPYLSHEWFDCVKACLDEAEKLDMQAWLYDEDRWPSGAAGGLVTQNPRFRRRGLVMREIRDLKKLDIHADTLALFAGKVNGASVSDLRRLPLRQRPIKLAKGETLLHFFVKTDAPSDWYNGQTYLDTLNHEAVRKFIQVTHEAYRRRIGKEFGRRVPGIFTDEPNYGHVCAPLGADATTVPWTGRLPAVFRRRHGYDLLPHLPELFLDIAGVELSRARYHFLETITFLFVDAFARQIGEWCDKNNLQHTGHVLAEESLLSQARLVGDTMRFYEYMQAPGTDNLTEHQREYDTAKQVSSVARQFDRRWRLTETYGCTGWDFSFAGHKAVSDWQLALGINLRCQHLFWYTMEGQAKRDYPAAISHQSPWWELYPKVEDYFARAHLVMTQGREVRDLLVIHPIESVWPLLNKQWKEGPAPAYSQMLIALRDALLAQNVDFDYGNEDILSRHGRVTRAAGAPVLRVAKADYKAVIVPPLLTIRRSTLELLRKFRRAGGAVVFAGEPPRFVDALPSSDAADFAASCAKAPEKGPGLARSVAAVARRVSIANPDGREIVPALHLLREDADAFYLFVCNTGHRPSQLQPKIYDKTMIRDRRAAFPDVRIRGFAHCRGNPIELDPETGDIFAADFVRRGEDLEIRTNLPALGSRLFIIPKGKGGKTYPRRPKLRDIRRQPLNRRAWPVTLAEANVLVLDRPAWRMNDQPWQKPTEIIELDRVIRPAMGAAPRGGQMVQPWARKPDPNPRHARLILRYRFDVAAVPSGDLFLAMERPETFRVELNGEPVNTDVECGWWCDRSLRKLRLDPAALRPGANDLRLSGDYTVAHPGLEAIYLLGDFGVNVSGVHVTMTAPPAALQLGDWGKQGLPFYAGSVAYRRIVRPRQTRNERLFVRVPAYRGVAVRVLVNGVSAGVIAWDPAEVDITPFLGADGAPVELRLEVIGHRRNSHGPLHISKKWPAWTGPQQFITRGEERIEGYQLVPCGLMKPPELVVKR